MGLKKYNKKRGFVQTNEPEGQKAKAGKKLRFVVQKHDATNLHYDLRLELDGVMLSWAVPKGPSINPEVKHLAMQVEDHPLDYRNFEGIIPKGNYGAGEVIVWDRGTYRSAESKDLKEGIKLLRKGLKNGDLKFILNGKKLKGEFVLVRLKKAGKNAWLLIKKKDKYASPGDILEEDKSVISGETISSLKQQEKSSNGKNS